MKNILNKIIIISLILSTFIGVIPISASNKQITNNEKQVLNLYKDGRVAFETKSENKDVNALKRAFNYFPEEFITFFVSDGMSIQFVEDIPIHKGVKPVGQYDSGKKTIYVDKNCLEEQMVKIIIHEIGHYITIRTRIFSTDGSLKKRQIKSSLFKIC